MLGIIGKGKDKTKNKVKRKGKKQDTNVKEITIKVPVPEIKKPKLFSSQKNRSLVTMRFPSLIIKVFVDKDNLHIDMGSNPDVMTRISFSKKDIPLQFKKQGVHYVWVYKGRDLDEYYVRGRGYPVRKIFVPPYRSGKTEIRTIVTIFIGQFSGKYPVVKFKGGRAYKEGIVEFEDKKADILVVMEQDVVRIDARSNMPIKYKNVMFRMAKIPSVLAEYWHNFDKITELGTDEDMDKVYDGLHSSVDDQYTVDIDAYDEDTEDEEEENSGGFLSKIHFFGRKHEDREDEEEEEEDDDDLPDVSI